MEFRDLKAQYTHYKTAIDQAIQGVIDETTFIGGSPVVELEKRLADYVGVKHCITCANGTEAMTLLMMAWDIKAGDAVFVPDFTFFSTGEIVSFCGATPIFIDVDKDTFNMDVRQLEKTIQQVIEEGKLSPKVIIPVDLFGLPANHLEIQVIADQYGLKILEDGAQGFGGSIKGQKACGFGHAATTSFFPAKPLGCYGDGGAIFTNDQSLALLLNSLKVHGKGTDKYDNVRIGVNSRLDTLQAAILNVKLTAFIDHELEDVNKIYRLYNEGLKNWVKVPYIPEGYESSFAQYTIRLSSKEQRDKVKEDLGHMAIPSMIYYTKPMHEQGAFEAYDYSQFTYANTQELCDTVLSLPMHPYMTEAQVNQVIEAVKKSLNNV